MSFIRKDRKGKEVYLRIVKNERQGDKIIQKNLYSLGKLSDYTPENLQNIAKQLYLLGGGCLDDLTKMEAKEIGRYNYGCPLILRKILLLFGFDKLCAKIEKKNRINFSTFDTLLLMLCNRWLAPSSKFGIYESQADYIGLPKIELQWLYRTLDKLSDYSDEIQKIIYQSGKSLLKYSVDVVFYDVTTFYFDSSKEKEGELRQMGFGKDGKIGKTQILLGLMIDKNRNPIGYQLYKGDTYEGHTLVDGVSKLKEKYNIGKVIFVADTGMMNKDNIENIEQASYDYIFGERLKNLPKAVKVNLLDRSKYKTMRLNDEISGETIDIQYTVTEHKARKILCTYSEKRAAKDKAERLARIEKAEKLLKKPQQLERKASHYFLKVRSEKEYELDQSKIEEAAKYDGLKAIACSDSAMSNDDILKSYRELYNIEHSFRTFKSFLETRPMFHWTDKRIQGHFAMCYISFAMLNYLKQKLKQDDIECLENKLRSTISKMEVSQLLQNKTEFYVRSNMDEYEKTLLKSLHITPLSDIVSKDLIINYLH
jgi:transposase